MNIINDINEKWLANSWYMNMWMDEMPFKCAESAYQSLKFGDPEVKMMFCDLDYNQAIEFSRLLTEQELLIEGFNPLTSMANALKAKFESSASLKSKLVNSFPSEIGSSGQEHPDISNESMGFLLSIVRDYFIEEGRKQNENH